MQLTRRIHRDSWLPPSHLKTKNHNQSCYPDQNTTTSREISHLTSKHRSFIQDFTPATPPRCWHAQIHIQALTQRVGGDQAQKSPAQPLHVAQMQHWMLQRAALPWHLPPSPPGCMDSAPMCPVPGGEQPWGHIQLTVIVCLQDKPILCEAGSSLCRQCYLTLMRTIHSPRTKESLV